MSMSHFLLHDLADEGSSTSDNGSVVSNCLSSISDDEPILASNNPKKRAGRKKFRETRHPIYRGVRRRNSGKWVCEMREPNKKSRIWLGTYPTLEMAARAHDVAAIALRGKSACLNFADSAWRLPMPASGETKDIQKAAAEAAEAFRPSVEVNEAETLKQIEQLPSSEDGNVINEEAFSPKDNIFSSKDNMFFMDEDEMFGMPRLISSMAEALMLPPPIHDIEEEAQEHHMELWNFSI
ncbi:hypothetical protein Leryth_006881 [Lithospermum erythrorhizon]|uniref:AP2/ERF domain-containing protein n=1 Tax=Lithospermum erythrorhizon TaxID=34254 RepID=A0AAV3QRG7_LITER|nr:hypothetical protein Leryth_006881 [Lithospermum erythrorhizon]